MDKSRTWSCEIMRRRHPGRRAFGGLNGGVRQQEAANPLQASNVELHMLDDVPAGSQLDAWSSRLGARARAAAERAAARPVALSASTRGAVQQGRAWWRTRQSHPLRVRSSDRIGGGIVWPAPRHGAA